MTSAPRWMSELLSKRSRWTKGAFARRGDGASVSAFDQSARSWCLLGAASKCGQGDEFLAWWAKHHRGSHRLGLTGWNDEAGRTFKEVRKVIAQFESTKPTRRKERK